MKAIRLRTEYMKNPMGIDIKNPRLMWNCEEGIKQTAYQIICTDEDEHTLWDSGKVQKDFMRAVYSGQILKSRTRVCWKVRLWDENNQAGEWSEEAIFEMGLLSPKCWRAKWITGNYRVNKKKRYPVDCFMKELEIDKKVCRARLYITACGIYEARLDGRKIGEFCLAPGITDYNKRVHYQTYDVTDFLEPGKHRLSVQMADGWYRGSVGAWGLRNEYGTETKFLGQLEILYEDGSKAVLKTGESWKWSDDGPIRFADNKDGEIVEAGRIPSYKKQAKVTSHPVTPVASNNVPVVEKERFSPAMHTAPNGRKLFDFGQNISGYLEFCVNAKEGQKIFIRCGELLDEEGNLTLKNIQCTRKDFATPLQEITYTCKEGENHYKTTFAVFGFQYAEVGTEVEISEDDVIAIAVYSDIEQTGYFESSNPLLNRLVDMTAWSTKGNSLDIPTDCPTRERHGWTGDVRIFLKQRHIFLIMRRFPENISMMFMTGRKKMENSRRLHRQEGGFLYERHERKCGLVGCRYSDSLPFLENLWRQTDSDRVL